MALEFLKDRGDSLAPKSTCTFFRLTDFESKLSHDLGEMKEYTAVSSQQYITIIHRSGGG